MDYTRIKIPPINPITNTQSLISNLNEDFNPRRRPRRPLRRYPPLRKYSMLTDTSPQIEQLQLDLLRNAPSWKKADMWAQMVQTAKLLALRGVKARHPKASENEINRRLAGLLLGEELAEKVYGPLIVEENAHAA